MSITNLARKYSAVFLQESHPVFQAPDVWLDPYYDSLGFRYVLSPFKSKFVYAYRNPACQVYHLQWRLDHEL